jgi:hypothetical protein
VPAHEEQQLISACVRAFGAQKDVGHDEYEVIVVLDRCTDDTEAVERAAAAEIPGFALLHAVEHGHMAIGGRIQLDHGEREALPDAFAVTGATYAPAGRIEGRAARGGEGDERVPRHHGIPTPGSTPCP